MAQAIAVIGACFGDEGKGLITDYCAHAFGEKALVIRYNGGAQAGHTVVTPQGRRHVFSHFGAGSLAGCQTYLSRHFIVNPIKWISEAAELADVTFPPMLVDARAPVTTPFDIMLNQQIERVRGSKRHGSCGMGINETMHRELTDQGFGIQVPARLIDSRIAMKNHLLVIREDYVPKRLDELGIEQSIVFKAMLKDDKIIDSFLNVCDIFAKKTISCRESDDYVSGREKYIFEGAQGLLLDQDHYFFPHVTHSKTGLHNVKEIVNLIGIEHLDVSYVTRAYMTRHGAGPFPSEDFVLRFDDQTNVSGEFQGDLRFGHLDLGMLRKSITEDFAPHDIASGNFSIAANLAVTHIDQMGDFFEVKHHGHLQAVLKTHLAGVFTDATGYDVILVSYGPRRIDVVRGGDMKRGWAA